MKSTVFTANALRIARSLALSTIFAAALAIGANAQTTTFAQFFEQLGTNDFGFINNTSSGNFDTIPGGTAVFFLYQNITGLDPSLQGIQTAHLFMSTVTTQPGGTSSGTVTQPFNQAVTIQIIRDTPAPPGVGNSTRTNLLTAVITPAGQTPSLTGADSGNSATFSVTTPDHTVTFSSHFITFSATTARNLALSFSSVSPSFALGSGSFLQTLTAAGSGTFASNPVPVPLGPTAADVSVTGRVLGPNGVPARNFEVLLTEQNGNKRIARTSNFGYFEFHGLESGQGVVVAVRSKRYQYQPQFISLSDNAFDLSFVPSN